MKKRLSIFLCFVFSLTGFCQYDTEIKRSAVQLIDSLSPLQQKRAILSADDTARIQWNNLPVGLRARVGISLDQMSEGQRKLFHRLLSASLSSQGYLKAIGIMQLDGLLNILYDTLHSRKEITDNDYDFIKGLKWSFQNFHLAFFGNPSSGNIWGYKIEGHHLSLNFTFNNKQVAVTPLFLGADPAEYPLLEYAGLRLLGQEEDLGIRLINKLNARQKKKATRDTTVPHDIITAAESGKRLITYWGIKASELNQEQQSLLTLIIREFVFNLEYDKGLLEYNKILKAGIQNIYFGWIGSYKEHEPHYFVLNGPTFLIEFDNFRNHIHAIWREKGNDFGEDILKDHYRQSIHK